MNTATLLFRLRLLGRAAGCILLLFAAFATTGCGGGASAGNTSQPPAVAATPTFSPASGTYSSAQTVTISTTTSGASIRYTTDGSTPSATSGTVYSGPITVSATTTINAIAYENGYTPSSVAVATFTIQPPLVAAPIFSPAGGSYSTPQTVTLSTFTNGASIRYTTDGSTPSETNGTLYSGPITVSTTTYINAIAYESGYTSSNVMMTTYTIQPPVVSTPTFNLAAGTYTSAQTVTLNTATPGASIRYTTDGSTPSPTSGTLYSSPIPVSATTTIKAIAYETGYTPSNVATVTYTITGTVAPPAFSVAAGTYSSAQTVTLGTTTPGASINYTIDGSTPSSTHGTPYSGPISVSSTTTINAIAFENGWNSSSVATAAYTITGTIATPTFSPAAGTYTSAQTVTISTITGGASINYTTDGSTPSATHGTPYSGPISVSSTTTINAIAYETGYPPSSVGTATYTITGAVATPTFSPAGGTYSSAQTVTLSTTTPGATINYTTDGSAPSSTHGTPYGSPISVSSTTTINAIAFENGWTSSPVATAAYTIAGTVATPTFSPAGGTYSSAPSVTLSTTTPGASINYTTDGSTPTATYGTPYSGPISVGATTINAIAFKTGWTPSSVATATYTISSGSGTAPVFAPGGGTYSSPQTVTITAAAGYTIVYTTDGVTTPSKTSGTTYTVPIVISTTTKLQAMAWQTGHAGSSVTSATYTISSSGGGTVAAPTFSLASGTYTSAQSVTISTTTSGASIRYTTDGSTPSASYGIPYTGLISVSSNSIINAIAVENGWTPSSVATATYTFIGTVATPTFSPAGGTYTSAQSVTLSTTTPGASINYTTDGTTPTATYGTPYSGPISVSSTATINAIAFESGWASSSVKTATYTITGTVATPTFSPAGGTYSSAQTVTLGTTTPGASINYTTDGSTPSPTHGTPYTGPITVSSTTAINAIAFENGWISSSVATATYTITGTIATPTFSPAAGTYTSAQAVTISTITGGAAINYTTDGSTPSATHGTPYGGPISVSSTTTINAIAYESGLPSSSVATATYTIASGVANPTFSLAAGTYASTQLVRLSTTTPGALINYTTDGSIPSPTSGTVFSGPITVSSTTTINAIAYKSGMAPSSIATATYTINLNTVAAPYFTPAPTSYATPPTVTIVSKTPGALINYTTDGSVPSPTTGMPYSGPIMVNSTTTFNAIAYASGMTPSAITTATFTISAKGQAAAPVLYPAAGTYTTALTVSIADSTSGVSILYTTDGSDPSTSGTSYTGPIPISSTTTIKTVAVGGGKTSSTITAATYTVNLQSAVDAPVFSPAGGTFSSPQAVTISTTTPGASILYTTNGLVPTPTTGTLYTGPISVSSTTPIMAVAYESGYNNSRVVTSQYTITCDSCPTVATPTFDPPAGQFTAATPVTITSSTPGALIYYTTDGSIPSETNGTIYNGPVTMQVPVNTDVTGYVSNASGVTMLKAVAIQSGSTPSEVFTGIYTIIDPLRLPPANSLVLGLAHMAYDVSAANWNNILSLWTDYLGFAVVPTPSMPSTFVLIKVNDQQFIELNQVPSIIAPQYQLANYGFYVSDCEAFRQQMAAAPPTGVTIPPSCTKNTLGNLSFVTTDPDGHPDEWVQYLPDSETAKTLGQFMPSTEMFGYINDFGETSASVANSVAYFGPFGFNPISVGSNHVSLPNINSYLELLTYQTLDQTQFGKHQKTQLVNFRGHDITDDALILQGRNLSIVQVTGEEGSDPVHSYIDLYDADLSRIRMIDLNY